MARSYILLLPLLLLPLLCFFLPPPRNKPAGVGYWAALGSFLFAIILLVLVSTLQDYFRYGRLVWWHAVTPLVCLGIVCALLANTFWVLGCWRRLPFDLGKEERLEALRRLSRRLWIPLCALGVLAVVPPFGHDLARTSIPSVITQTVGFPGRGPVIVRPVGEPLGLVDIQRLPDGAYRIGLVYRVPGGPYELGVLQFSSPRLQETGTSRSWPCTFQSQAEWKGEIPSEVSLVLRVSPPPGMRKGNLLIEWLCDAKSGLKKTFGFTILGLPIDLPPEPPPS